MRRLLSILALLAACGSVGQAPVARADPTWTYLPSLPSPSESQLQLFVDVPRHRYLLVGEGPGGTRHPLVWARPIDGSSRWRPLACSNTPTVGSPSIILDPVRDRLVLWDPNSWWLWTTSLSEPLVWSYRAIPNGANVRDPGVAYDARHRRMLLFSGGGMGQASTSDVLALPLDDDQAVWSALPAQGTPPTPRLDAVAIVDTLNDRLIVHGGRDFSYLSPHNVRGDVWALSLSDSMGWAPLFTADDSSSQCYAYHSAVYDPVRQRMLLFGGGTGDYSAPGHAEVRAFALDGTNAWSIAAGPDSTRGLGVEYNATVYDPGLDAVLEYDPDRYTSDERPLFRLALSPTPAWSVVEPHAAKPPWRFGMATAFDPVGNRWLSFGGRVTYYTGNVETETYQDLWSLRIADRPDWQLLAPGGSGPPPVRQDGRMLYDPRGDRMILFGGQVTTGVDRTFVHNPGLGTPHFYGDTWALRLRDDLVWTPLAAESPAPGPRDGHLLVLDAKRNRALLFGGRDSLGGMNDLWALSLAGTPTWTQLAPTGVPPSPRWQMFGCYDATEERLVVVGGVSAAGAEVDAFALPLADSALAWTPLVTAGTPATMGPYPRPQVFDPGRRRILVFGDGSASASAALPAWTLDLGGTPTWAPLVANGNGPTAAYGFGAAFDSLGDRVLLAGGTSGTKGMDTRREEWLLSFSTPYPITGVALSSLVVSAHRVELDWQTTPVPGGIVTRVERIEAGEPWRDVGAATAAADDHLRFVDTDVAPSLRYGYRLRVTSRTNEIVSEETWVTIPGQLAFVLEPPRPNPASGSALVSFDLPRSGRVDLAVYDISGRRLERHDMDAGIPGRYSVSVGQGLPPGLYFVRLSAGGDTRATRLCIVR